MWEGVGELSRGKPMQAAPVSFVLLFWNNQVRLSREKSLDTAVPGCVPALRKMRQEDHSLEGRLHSETLSQKLRKRKERLVFSSWFWRLERQTAVHMPGQHHLTVGMMVPLFLHGHTPCKAMGDSFTKAPLPNHRVGGRFYPLALINIRLWGSCSSRSLGGWSTL